MNVDISFILPTNRDFRSFSKNVIDNINRLNFENKTHEIIHIAPYGVVEDNVISIIENKNSGGCVAAYNVGYAASTGKFIVLASDDHFFDYNSPKIIDVLQSDLFSNRRYAVICLPTNKHGPCKLPGYTNCNGIIARYPVFSRSTIDNYFDGIIYHPSFNHHYPDNWLGYWLNKQGEDVIEHHEFDMITFNGSCEKKYDNHDENVFDLLIKRYESGYNKYI